MSTGRMVPNSRNFDVAKIGIDSINEDLLAELKNKHYSVSNLFYYDNTNRLIFIEYIDFSTEKIYRSKLTYGSYDPLITDVDSSKTEIIFKSEEESSSISNIDFFV